MSLSLHAIGKNGLTTLEVEILVQKESELLK